MDPDQRSNAKSPNGTVTRVRWWRRFGTLVTAGVVLYVIVGGVLLLKVPDRLLANWFPDLTSQERAAFLGPATTAVLFALGGTIALVGVGLSLSRHRQELEAAARDRERLHDDREREQARRDEVDAQRRIETERALRERFVTTVKLLSDTAPVNRQAALFALGALADDWDAFGKSDEVQVCIEVLTGYLRAPRSDEMLGPLSEEEHDQLDPSERREAQRTTPQEVSVKQAGYAVIRTHLREDGPARWHNRVLNLAGAHIDFTVDLSLTTIANGGAVILAEAKITNRGAVYLSGATITDRGSVNLTGATITNGGYVLLASATITNRGSVSLDFASVTNGGVVNVDNTTITNSGTINFSDATITDRGYANLDFAKVTNGGWVTRPDGTRRPPIKPR
ncbi:MULTISPECIES: hypothetical protein [Microbacterium]|uniref:hypothetical protein n=1 Tax=Microbacterium TaxID=33882 RepID=UPI0027D80372|nr:MULTISPECIES: hypothetical protein [Microbacterium]